MTWYNEIDPFAARWLRELQAGSLIEKGFVDERRIETIETLEEPRAHFFAGIGGWDYALRLAGWPVDRPVWTGSCPCQPFSVAGKGAGEADPRHLWPAWFRLIRECRPDTIFGEQVAGAIGHGWLDGVFTDLEAEGYTCGAVVLGAHSVGAPHIRQRLYWVADATNPDRRRGIVGAQAGVRPDGERRRGSTGNRASGRLGDSDLVQSEQPAGARARSGEADGGRPCGEPSGSGETGWLGDANGSGREELRGAVSVGAQQQPAERGGGAGHWSSALWHPCSDGSARRIPTQPALQPLAPGLQGRVGILRGAGNSIVPQVAAAFVRAYMEEAIRCGAR